jgi:polysaccharide export outer membrane protein
MKYGMQDLVRCGVFLLLFSVPLLGQGNGNTPDGNGATQSNSSAQPQPNSAGNQPHDASYVIGNDDKLDINVWKEPELSKTIPVRSDGKISLPLVGEIQAAGRTPLQLEQTISEKLKTYMTAPEVTVMVEQVNSKKYNIMGEVARPGAYPLTLATTIMDAIAGAGGFREFAKRGDVYILRQNPDGTQTKISFNYKQFIKGKHLEQNVKVEPQDTIIVP